MPDTKIQPAVCANVYLDRGLQSVDSRIGGSTPTTMGETSPLIWGMNANRPSTCYHRAYSCSVES